MNPYHRLYSFNQMIPSKDMSPTQYSVYLQYAHRSELEMDIVYPKTFYKICEKLGFILQNNS